ncbi:hypothetical protein CR513_40366, partial [Mucuna pruriens]
MKRIFLEKFVPVSRTTSIMKEICGIRQHGETIYEYWERFNKLCATCPHHQISEQLLIQYFYEGLMLMDRSMIDATSGGALMDKTQMFARNLISNMVGNTQGSSIFKVVNEVVVADNHKLENKITDLTSLVRQLAIGQHYTSPPVRVCGNCASIEHPTDICPTLQETEPNTAKIAAMIGGQQYKQSYDQYSNWRYGLHLMQHSKGSKHIPSQTILSPQANMSGITLRSGKELPQQQTDHFPLLFINQVLERLADKSYYCFMDGFSSYMYIHIALTNQQKITFTCPFGTFDYIRMSFDQCNASSTFQKVYDEYLF